MQLNARKDAREAFLRGETAGKYDPSSREIKRERDKDIDLKTEKSVLYSSTTSNHHHTSSNMPTIGHSSSSAKEIDGYVGFANLPNQVYRKAVKRGFEFTLMVVGKCNLISSYSMHAGE